MAIIKYVPLLPIMTQVVETHIYTCRFCKLAYNAIFLYQQLIKVAKGNFSSVPCIHICSRHLYLERRSGTNLTMAISQPEIIQMFRKL